MRHLVIVRTGANVLDLKTYNCQELGLAKALVNKGLKVSLVMAGYEKKKETYPCDEGLVDVYFLRFKSIDQRYGFFIGISDTLSILKPDLIQVHDLGIFMTWYVTKWANRNKVPCYLIQGAYQLSPKKGVRQIEYIYYSLFAKDTLRNVSGIGCKTKMASRFIKHFLDCETKMTCIGLDESKFKDPIVKDWRKDLGICEKKILLYVGVMENRRRPHFLLDVAKSLPDDFVMIFVGNGPKWDDLKKRIEIERLQQRVYLLGKLGQEQLPSLYKCADLFLLASEYEIYGMVILEAMYYGVPVVSSYTAGSETIIDQNEDGVIVNEFDVNKWRNIICYLCEDNSRLTEMKKKAQKKISEEYVWQKAVEPFLDLYKSDIK